MLSSLTRSSRGLLIIGAILAVAAFALVVLLLNQKPTNTNSAPPAATLAATATVAGGTSITSTVATPAATQPPAGTQEVTALRDVPAGTQFSDPTTLALYFKNQPVPQTASVPIDAVASTDALSTSLISNTVRITSNIKRGSVLTTSSFELEPFSPPYSEAYQVRPGRVAESVQVPSLNADNGAIMQGDFVDVFLTLPDKDLSAYTFSPPANLSGGSDQTQQILQDVRVIDARPITNTYTLELTPQDALLLKFVKDNGGTIDLALMSSTDVKTQAAPPKTEAIVPQYFLTPQAIVKGTPQANGVIDVFDTPLPTLTPIPTPR